MKVLLASPYPPARDGLAAYSVQLVLQLRRAGDMVTVISPQPSGAPLHADFRTTAGMLRLLRATLRHDRTLVQFHPDFFMSGLGKWQTAQELLRLGLFFRFGRSVEVYVHEVDYNAGRRRTLGGALMRWVWQQPRRLLVHTEQEQRDIVAALRVDPSRVGRVAHGSHFIRRVDEDRMTARRRLGIADDEFAFLCIGFIQPHKGFDRAVWCFQQLQRNRPLRLDVVGSMRVATPDFTAHLRSLRRLVEETPGSHLHEGYIGDAAFDRWILACDAVVLPYRQIWSSGVMERAALYDRPVVVTAVGGLPHQARAASRVVRTAAEMVQAMADLAGVSARPGFDAPPVGDDPRGWAQAVVAARAAAARRWYEPSYESPSGRTELPPLRLPQPPRVLTPKTAVLKAVYRVTRWELWPIVQYTNRLRELVVSDQDDGAGLSPPDGGR
ncbi:MAG TPA: glycosyltransferase family 4 protein [Dehalococcoidia bacterium]|nr:glycosyltransferase family 4 protein [Dehalococcoidia bacterium]